MPSNILVTVGIPVYNGEKFIANAIESVLNQTYKNFELIISDDGSNDSTLDIIKSFDDSRIIIISDGMNKGISYRLNQQIEIAKGHYFFRMDGDDIMFSDRLEKQVKVLEANEKIDVIGSSAIIIDDENNIIGKRDTNNATSLLNAYRKTLFIHPTVAGKTEWFKRNKYSNELNGVEDYELWARTFKNSCFYTIDDPVLYYRDPLEFKLKTYRFRLKQLRIAYKKNKQLLSYLFFIVYILIIITYIKELLAIILTCLSQDSFMISKRNNKKAKSSI